MSEKEKLFKTIRVILIAVVVVPVVLITVMMMIFTYFLDLFRVIRRCQVKPLFIFLLLFAAVPAMGQVVPKHTYLVGGCKASATEAVEIFKEAKAAPPFDLYIVCDSAQWHALAMKNDFKESSHSFTVLHKGMIWLGPKALNNLHEAIDHELEHLRCDCDLGER